MWAEGAEEKMLTRETSVTEGWRTLHDDELNGFCFSTDIIVMIGQRML
jgi:hypothetical protein